MKQILLHDIVQLVNGEVIQGSLNWYVRAAAEYNRHKIRTRKTLIFATRNQQLDWESLKKVEPYAVITDKKAEHLQGAGEKVTIIRVDRIREAFWTFVHYYRNLFSIPVVAITGTCGKTTTREMIKHILDEHYETQATVKNLNEPRRSFLYLQGIDDETDAAVFETGLGNPGNLKYHCMIYEPTIGIITTIGVDHLEYCKTLEGYIQAKAEIVAGIRADGTLILNADDENIQKISLQQFKGKVVYFGQHDKAHIRASNIQYSENGMTFTLSIQQMDYPIFVPGYGEHQVYNALAAISAVHEMGIGIREAANRLKTFKNMIRHLEMTPGVNGSTIVDDTWSNNSTSIEAALNVLQEIGKEKKTVVLLGDIQQLGDYDKEIHRQVGSMVAKAEVDVLLTVGPMGAEVAKQALLENFQGTIYTITDFDEVRDAIMKELNENTMLLIKGSRLHKPMAELAESLKLADE